MLYHYLKDTKFSLQNLENFYIQDERSQPTSVGYNFL